ncbi:hypothetical protein [Castellaniella sp. MT123]|uniref:hypothetical protein n=1 Tax=Castellaniella sp. MT123 TaxID=3140381 RepID=UPI0031F46E13
MAALPTPARSAHTFPLTEREARHSARLWFIGTPSLTLTDWRDTRCRTHCAGLPELPERATVFNAEFAREIASIIAGVSHE